MSRTRWLLPLMLLAIGGCGDPPQVIGGVPREKTYRKVVSLSPSTTEILVAYANTPPIVAGRTQSDNYPTYSVPSIPIVASLKPDYEKIKEIGADLIVYDDLLYNEQDIEKLKAQDIETFKFSANTVGDFVKELYALGAKVGGETMISEYVDKINAEAAAAQGDPFSTKPKVAIIMPGASSQHYIAGTQSFQADIVRIAGGEPVGPEANRFVTLNAEALVALNPDAIIVPISKEEKDKAQADADVAAILKDPRLQSIVAVKDRKIFGLNKDVVLRRGARVHDFINGVHRGLKLTLEGQ